MCSSLLSDEGRGAYMSEVRAEYDRVRAQHEGKQGPEMIPLAQARANAHKTDWDRYGHDRNPKCAQCMAHCGYEPTAVNDALAHPLKALHVALRGPRTEGAILSD